MRVLMDEKACPVEADSVAQAIDHAAALAEQVGRMIVGVEVDGRELNDEQIDAARRTRQGADEVHFRTEEPRRLVRQVFADAAQALVEADDLQRKAAQAIEADQRSDAMRHLAEALSIWGSVQQALQLGASMVELSLDEQAERSIARLNDLLRLMRDALQADDPIGLSDTLQYDLPTVVLQWRELLTDLQQRIDEPSSSGEGAES